MEAKVHMEFVDVARLEHAPWNPRGEEELSHDNPAMVELIESVKGCGVMQSLAVWDRETDGEPLLVIAGNRRLEAAKAAGITHVHAMVYTSIDEARAREITRAENEIRQNVNPLRDAKLIDEMIDMGLSQKEIAAHFAMSEAMVCRRRKLCGLVPEVRVIAETKRNISTDALERIALYPEDTQRECAQAISRRASGKDASVKWGDIKWEFERTTRSLDDVKFNTDACKVCALRTGAQADLWGEVPKKGCLGSCLKKSCYERKAREVIVNLAREQIGDGVEMVDAERDAGVYLYELSNNDMFGDRKCKARPVAWWIYESYSGKIKVYWGPTLIKWKDAKEEAERKRREEEAMSKAEREQRDAEAKAAMEQARKIQEERSHLKRVASDIAEEACEAFADFGEEKTKVCIKVSTIGRAFKVAEQSDKIVDIVWEWMDGGYADTEDYMRLFVAFPNLALQLGVDQEKISDWRKARTALERFERDHAKKED